MNIDDMRAKELGIKTYESSHLRNIWQMLGSRRGDLVIEWPAAALPDIELLQLTGRVVDTGIVISSMPFHLMIGKDSAHVAVLAEFDRTIMDMKRDGTLESIIRTFQ